MNGYSKSAEDVLKALSDEEKKILKRDYPFKTKQAKILKRMRDNGVKLSTINEITGIPKSTISRLANTYVPKTRYAVLNELKAIRKRLDLIEGQLHPSGKKSFKSPSKFANIPENS
ncbi:hypothetical protein DSCW_26050 [Desulfosarcina widdelii]|uniref:Uncharacterized protein n=1 Tax=Desulfosarcina widdelii TaxID=947919 RepID=A0A5K7Z2K6_9BACT|nr:hypothetical protein [Desulfosarcina widdelii]BBO75188.1 hypothetical protein DSCW_26050 [Desulfosarcina widdelii]